MAKLVSLKGLGVTSYDWFDIYSDAKIKPDGKVSILFHDASTNKNKYIPLEKFHISSLRSMINRYNMDNEYNRINAEGLERNEAVSVLQRLIKGDDNKLRDYRSRIEKATGLDIKLSQRDIERSNELFRALKKHPEDPLRSDMWTSEGIIKEVWKLTQSDVKFSNLEERLYDWLEQNGVSSGYRRYTDEEADEILSSLYNPFKDGNDDDFWDMVEVNNPFR